MNEPFSPSALGARQPVLNTVSADGQSDGVSSGRTILIVEDDSAVARTAQIMLQLAGHGVEIAADPQAAYSMLARRRFDAILLDMNFGAGQSDGAEGQACLTRIVADDPAACVVVITAHSGIRIAVTAMQAGARDFVMKPWRKDDLLARINAAIGRGVTAANLAPAVTSGVGCAGLIGASVAMERVRALIRRIGPTTASVCITGHSGSGRSLVAAAIHAASVTAATSPVRIDLTDPDQWSLIGGAGDTIVLRHPDRLSPTMQARLLDRLVPGLRCIGIAASVTPLIPALRRRLSTAEIAVPPLAARREDAVPLARHFAHAAAESFGRAAPRLTPAAEAFVAIAEWPDEVRGLASAIERAVLLSDDGTIDAAALRPAAIDDRRSDELELSFALGDAERLMIEAALKEHRHNVSRAAAALGLSRGTLYRRMAQHGL